MNKKVTNVLKFFSILFVISISLMLSGILIQLIGLENPLPEGSNSTLIFILSFIGFIFIVTILILVNTRIKGNALSRILILSTLFYVTYIVLTLIEGIMFTTISTLGGILTPLIIFILPVIASSILIVYLFPGSNKETTIFSNIKYFLSRRKLKSWIIRFFIVWLSFILIYLGIGSLIAPIVNPYYELGISGLVLPSLWQIIALQMIRSLIMIPLVLFVVSSWDGSNKEFLLIFSITLYILIGFFPLLLTYWLPIELLIIHNIEILIDSLLFGLVVGYILVKKNILPISRINNP